MPRHVICALWMSASVLHGCATFLFNASAQHRTLNRTDAKESEVFWESPFLQLRASLSSYSQPIRPYTLLTNVEDYHYLPKPAHRRASRLLRLLGSSFDPFWMSIEGPSGSRVPLHGDKRLKKAAALEQQRLEKEAAALDLGSLPPQVATSVRVWLVRSSTCRLRHRWVDLGPAFWPRWLRQTECERSGGGQSCSFPGGMECTRAQTTNIRILAWHCLESRVGDGAGTKSDAVTETEMDEFMKRCVWRQVPYPVVTACTCSCK
uniref:Noggin n=1 Tax=Tetraodon nigroviridis TaxID=99883 RepID=H3C3H0_TETNG